MQRNAFTAALHEFSGGGAQYIDPIKPARPHDATSRTPGPPPPPKRPGRFTRWGRKIFYGTVAAVVIGGTIWIFSMQPDRRSAEQIAATETAEARATRSSSD